MTFTFMIHKVFNVTEWFWDTFTINPHLNPEIEKYTIQTDQELGSLPIVGISSIRKEILLIGVSWLYRMKSKSSKKDIFRYKAEDEYLIYKHEKEEIKDVIKASYINLSQEFVKRRGELGIIDDLPPFEQSSVDQFYLDTLALLKKKGV